MSKGADVIDTCVLILGMEHANGGAEHPAQAERAFEYLRSLEEKKLPAVVPSVVVAELLNGLDDEAAKEAWEQLDNNFIIAPFDGQAAVLGARAIRAAMQARKAGVGPSRPSRHEAKVDGMIVGVAMATGAGRIVSFNLRDFKHAAGPVEVDEPPQLALAKRIDFDASVN